MRIGPTVEEDELEKEEELEVEELAAEVELDVGVGVEVGVELDVGVGVEVGEAHVALVIVLVSKVTVPFCANTLPSTLAPVVSVADVKAMTVPIKSVPIPSVAELPICQKT